MPKKDRKLPRSFDMHWGSGEIVEEASHTGPHHEPCIQLMEYHDGDAAGTTSVRFCFYDHAGRFQRGPLIVDDECMAGLRAALKKTPRLRALLRKMVT